MFNLTVKELWDIIKIGGGILGGLISGIIMAVWVVSGYKNRLENSEQTIALLKGIIFKDKEGLNVLTVAAHEEKCGEKELLFSKDYSMIIEKIESLEKNVEKINIKLDDDKTEKHLEAVKTLISSINKKLSVAFSHDRRSHLRNLSDAEILSEKEDGQL